MTTRPTGVVAGLTGGQHDPETVPTSDRPAESVNWGTISPLLESAVSMPMGSLLRRLLDQVHASTAGAAVGLVALVELAVRMVFVGDRKQPRNLLDALASAAMEELDAARSVLAARADGNGAPACSARTNAVRNEHRSFTLGIVPI